MIEYDWIIECPCGCRFSAAGQKRWRGQGGRYLDKQVEASAMENKIEVQCPNCLLWLDSTTGGVNDFDAD